MATDSNLLFDNTLFQSVETADDKITSDKPSDPTVIFGNSFANKEECIAYFKNQLSNKIGEISKQEGFPEGPHSTIVEMSAPPYYTACPNPWIKDFLSRWESEKYDLEKNGIRSSNDDTIAPYASDVSEGKNNPIYMAHAYHTKVPHLAIMKYILHYTQPGDIVFDGFCGTGMTGVAANLCGSLQDVLNVGGAKEDVGVRKCICSDLSPIASLISASYNIRFDPKEFQKRANAILDKAVYPSL